MDKDRIDVAALREALGWTQQQFAEHFATDRSTVSKWEREPPSKGPALVLLRQLRDRVSGAACPEKFDPSSLDGVPHGAAAPAGLDAPDPQSRPAFSSDPFAHGRIGPLDDQGRADGLDPSFGPCAGAPDDRRAAVAASGEINVSEAAE